MTGVHITLGSVSLGTLRFSDLLPVFADELRRLDPDHRLVKEADGWDGLDEETGDVRSEEDADELLADLQDALNGFAPDYVYFGTHPGDGADFGWWPDLDRVDEDRRDGSLDSGDELPEDAQNGSLFLHVSDHGNLELYRRDDGKWSLLWSCV